MSTGLLSPSVVLRHSNDVLTLTPWQAGGKRANRYADRAGAESMLRLFMNDDGNRLAVMRLCHAIEPGYTLAGSQTSAGAARHMAGLIASGKVLAARTGEAAEYVEGQFPYTMRQLAYLPARGTGVNGSYFLRGHYVVDGRDITVSAMGFTSVMRAGSVRFFASARLSIDGQQGEPHPLTQDDPGYWPSDEYAPIGAAQWELPEVRHGQSIALVISAGYVFETVSGRATPMPATTEREFPLALA
ncbi:hypothetical protein [Bordetella petrii]|uniref:Uncharacterized protein n=1 Tax=Bordetella petrii (strain ATCC BAA-461 / DSM 12804 / CCUG 43448 / CIP 107267 / Se-1111R) TaxID=340100 RepID=A9INJ4_BORPD|nr:hypothetical protein [Bordetella petrii]CAP42841.1 hypothetical protein predicted by Glimmer/Critica [Bordetella petrii]